MIGGMHMANASAVQNHSPRRYAVDTDHTRLDQRLDAVAMANLGEDLRPVSARLWCRLPDANGRAR
jgi:hypothetical protein